MGRMFGCPHTFGHARYRTYRLLTTLWCLCDVNKTQSPESPIRCVLFLLFKKSQQIICMIFTCEDKWRETGDWPLRTFGSLPPLILFTWQRQQWRRNPSIRTSFTCTVSLSQCGCAVHCCWAGGFCSTWSRRHAHSSVLPVPGSTRDTVSKKQWRWETLSVVFHIGHCVLCEVCALQLILLVVVLQNESSKWRLRIHTFLLICCFNTEERRKILVRETLTDAEERGVSRCSFTHMISTCGQKILGRCTSGSSWMSFGLILPT